MAAGLQVDRAVLDSQSGRLALDLRNTLEAVARLQTWMGTQDDADLAALGYSPAEVTVLKTAIADMDALVDVATGRATVTEARNFFVAARRLVGLN